MTNPLKTAEVKGNFPIGMSIVGESELIDGKFITKRVSVGTSRKIKVKGKTYNIHIPYDKN